MSAHVSHENLTNMTELSNFLKQHKLSEPFVTYDRDAGKWCCQMTLGPLETIAFANTKRDATDQAAYYIGQKIGAYNWQNFSLLKTILQQYEAW